MARPLFGLAATALLSIAGCDEAPADMPSEGTRWDVELVPPAVESGNEAGLAEAAQDRVPFTASIQGETTNLSRFFALVMPGEELTVSVVSGNSEDMVFIAKGGEEFSPADAGFTWIAPDTPGHFELSIVAPDDTGRMDITAFVLRPLEDAEGDMLNGFELGQYADEEGRHLPPAGLIEFTPDMKDIRLSPHFDLYPFLSAPRVEAPYRYLYVRPALIKKLEALLDVVNESLGKDIGSFEILSGYRTPAYNAARDNSEFSRHIFGDAADIFVDHDPRDGTMDDLNGDGVADLQDAVWLMDLAVEFDARADDYDVLPGGIGLYDANSQHGPFVHIDARGGVSVTWGRD